MTFEEWFSSKDYDRDEQVSIESAARSAWHARDAEIAALLRDERARADCGHPKACWQETLVCGRCERPLPCIQHTKIGGRAETKSIGHCAWCADLARERARAEEEWKRGYYDGMEKIRFVILGGPMDSIGDEFFREKLVAALGELVARERARLNEVRKLAADLDAHSDKYIYDVNISKMQCAAVEGVIADRIKAILDRKEST